MRKTGTKEKEKESNEPIIETIETIMPIAIELGCQDALKSILIQLEEEIPPYRKQLDMYNQNNDFKDLLSNFVNTFKESVFN